MALDAGLAPRLREAVAARREELIELTCALVRERSLLGEEEGAQRLVEDRLRRLGFTVERVPIELPAEDDGTWGYPPLESYAGRTCVAGRVAGAGPGRSLHLSGHVDVVPVEAPETWRHDPWAGEVADGRVWGRGAGDMKAGLAAYLVGAAAYLEVCGAPHGDLLFSSVIEEECTGNGMKAVLAAGYDADATLIGEPSELRLMHAGAGVIWARLRARSAGAHVAFGDGTSSSQRMLAALGALGEMERRLNLLGEDAEARTRAGADAVFLLAHDRPFRLNAGTFAGGAWPSSEPATVEVRLRVGFGPSLTPTEAQQLVAETVRGTTPEVEVSFEGFRAVAYCDDLDHDLALTVSAAHAALHGGAPARQVLAATTDARSVAGPCICYGPTSGAIHATDEWVDIDSIEDVAATVALTIDGWQRAEAMPRAGLEPAPPD
ncbi:MAG: acetylornithine deacetylase [Solirubrobacteraceae bacterium]|nr:acetylornithine deacetylase [Solirubrobacteraceae bacterium]